MLSSVPVHVKVLRYQSIIITYQYCYLNSRVLSIFRSPINDNLHITKTRLHNFDLLNLFYMVKLGFTGVYIIFLISAQKHRLWVLVRTASVRQF